MKESTSNKSNGIEVQRELISSKNKHLEIDLTEPIYSQKLELSDEVLSKLSTGSYIIKNGQAIKL